MTRSKDDKLNVSLHAEGSEVPLRQVLHRV